MSTWWEQVESEFALAVEFDKREDALRSPPDLVYDVLKPTGDETEPDFVHRVTSEDRFSLLTVSGDDARLLRLEGHELEIRFLGAPHGGIYTETVRGLKGERERDMCFEHERLPSGAIYAYQRPFSPGWRAQYGPLVSEAQQRTSRLRDFLIRSSH